MIARRAFIAACAALVFGACKAEPAGKLEVTVAAAASLQDAMRELSARYERQNPGVHVQLDFAGSNALAQQIVASHAADLFFSADEKWMDFVDDKGLLVAGTRRSLLSNTLVIAARQDSTIAIARPLDLAGDGYDKLVIADPDAVPAGRYAKRYLEGLKLWDKVSARVVPALDVRAALAAVAADPRRVGIVYASDLVASPGVRALYRVPVEAGPPIRYPIAQIAGRPEAVASKRLLEFLESDGARDVYAKQGFTFVAPVARTP